MKISVQMIERMDEDFLYTDNNKPKIKKFKDYHKEGTSSKNKKDPYRSQSFRRKD